MIITQARRPENKDPRRLPRFCGGANLWYGGQALNSTAFQTAIQYSGALSTTALSAGVFDTLLEISGAGGYLGSVIGPASTTGAETTFRITVDGQEYTILTATADLGQRCAIGSSGQPCELITSAPSNDVSSYGVIVPDTAAKADIPAAAVAVGLGLLTVRFDSYLKVEIANENAVSSGNSGARGASYVLD